MKRQPRRQPVGSRVKVETFPAPWPAPGIVREGEVISHHWTCTRIRFDDGSCDDFHSDGVWPCPAKAENGGGK